MKTLNVFIYLDYGMIYNIILYRASTLLNTSFSADIFAVHNSNHVPCLLSYDEAT